VSTVHEPLVRIYADGRESLPPTYADVNRDV
jgi:hypothetical protein